MNDTLDTLMGYIVKSYSDPVRVLCPNLTDGGVVAILDMAKSNVKIKTINDIDIRLGVSYFLLRYNSLFARELYKYVDGNSLTPRQLKGRIKKLRAKNGVL